MIKNELLIWDALNNSKKSKLNASWLAETYSIDLTRDLRFAIGEQLGLMREQGWKYIHSLVDKVGAQPELINAARLSCQTDARDWLLKLLNESSELNLDVIKALAGWGEEIPNNLLKKVVNQKSQEIRLAGLELIKFKSYLLADDVLLDLLKVPLNDFRDLVVIHSIKILQKRDSKSICNILFEKSLNGTETTSKIAIQALGCIGNESSKKKLLMLLKTQTSKERKTMAKKQLLNQYRVLNT